MENKENIRYCDFSYIDTKTGENIHCYEKEKLKENENNRLYCVIHQLKVDAINNIRKEQYINEYKQKIIIWLNKQISIGLCDSLKEVGKLTTFYKVIEFIKNGEFNNEQRSENY